MVLQEAGVMVRVSGPDPQGLKSEGRAFYAMESGRTTLSASGFICRSNKVKGKTAVVTSASVLAPFIKLDEFTQEPRNELISGCVVEAFLESGRLLKCKLVAIVNLKQVVEAAEMLIGARTSTKRGVGVGSIALLEAQGAGKSDVLPALFSSSSLPRRGDALIIASSPFGLVSPRVFQNSVTTGIVSNVIDLSRSYRSDGKEEPALFLTDGRCLPGAEGGVVFNSAGHVIGIVAPPFQRRDKSHLELGGVIPLALFRERLGLFFDHLDGGIQSESSKKLLSLETNEERSNSEPQLERERNSLLHSLYNNMTSKEVQGAVTRCAESVVLICINSSWGSGVVVSAEGHILTCAHLFRPFANVDKKTQRLRLSNQRTSIAVIFRDSLAQPLTRCIADLVFCSQGPNDLALLKLRESNNLHPSLLLPIHISNQKPTPGEQCIALGHAIFDPSAQLSATVSAGVLAKVVPHPRDPTTPAMLQTCTSVYRGHSGGLLANRRGELIGILTSNARHSNGDIIPTINFSVPTAMLQPLLDSLTMEPEMQDVIFDAYDRDDPQLLSLWKLEGEWESIEEKHDESIPTNSHESLKGTRFGEFLNQFSSKL